MDATKSLVTVDVVEDRLLDFQIQFDERALLLAGGNTTGPGDHGQKGASNEGKDKTKPVLPARSRSPSSGSGGSSQSSQTSSQSPSPNRRRSKKQNEKAAAESLIQIVNTNEKLAENLLTNLLRPLSL